jgi:hypothetical protein
MLTLFIHLPQTINQEADEVSNIVRQTEEPECHKQKVPRAHLSWKNELPALSIPALTTHLHCSGSLAFSVLPFY